MGSWGALILAVMLLFGCGEKEEKIEIPPDQSTPEQREKIDLVLNDIQEQFTQAGVKIDVRSLPIVVRDIEPSGYCQWDEDHRGIYIALDPDIFADDKFDEDSAFVPMYYHTILHEIGHCHFRRPHESDSFKVAGKTIYFNSARVSYADIPVSVMNDKNWISIPVSFRDYYVRETAALARIQTIEDLQLWDDVELRQLLTPFSLGDLSTLRERFHFPDNSIPGPTRRLSGYCGSH